MTIGRFTYHWICFVGGYFLAAAADEGIYLDPARSDWSDWTIYIIIFLYFYIFKLLWTILCLIIVTHQAKKEREGE